MWRDPYNKTHLKLVVVTMQRCQGCVNVERSLQQDSPQVSGVTMQRCRGCVNVERSLQQDSPQVSGEKFRRVDPDGVEGAVDCKPGRQGQYCLRDCCPLTVACSDGTWIQFS